MKHGTFPSVQESVFSFELFITTFLFQVNVLGTLDIELTSFTDFASHRVALVVPLIDPTSTHRSSPSITSEWQKYQLDTHNDNMISCHTRYLLTSPIRRPNWDIRLIASNLTNSMDFHSFLRTCFDSDQIFSEFINHEQVPCGNVNEEWIFWTHAMGFLVSSPLNSYSPTHQIEACSDLLNNYKSNPLPLS